MLNRMKCLRPAYRLILSLAILCVTYPLQQAQGQSGSDWECMTAKLSAAPDTDSVVGQFDKAPLRYLYPYNLHLTDGATSAVPLTLRDSNGNPVSGVVNFGGYDPSLISISGDGFVTALRQEGPNEIGTWVHATIDGQIAANTCIVRVLGQDYDLSFNEIVGENTVLYYPAAIDGEDIEAYVQQYEIAEIDEYAYDIQAKLMGLKPFQGGRQILEIDMGEGEASRVCGISGNPLRLGWNIEGNVWQNCFLVPFLQPRSPQWFVMFHEIGHNFTWPSYTFGIGLGPVGHYSEGYASIVALEAIRTVVGHPSAYNIGTDAKNSLQFVYNMQVGAFAGDFQNWLASGADFGALDANIVDGLWMNYRDALGEQFCRRFFLPLQPQYQPSLSWFLDSVQVWGDGARHTLFASLVSAAAREDLLDIFQNNYHFPVMTPLYDSLYVQLTAIMDASDYICGDADGNERIDITDVVFLVNYIFAGGPAPDPPESGDADCRGSVDIVDAVYLINYIFAGGAAPCSACL